MKIINIVGGLGNQMFQYAFALALQQATGDEVVLNTSWFPEYGGKLMPGETRRLFGLKYFKIRLPVCPLKNEHTFYYGTGLSGLVNHLLGRRTHLIEEQRMDLTIPGKLRQLKGDFILKGYFQHACFAEAVRGSLQEDFLLTKHQPDSANKLILEAIQNPKHTAVAVHIRRGDYLNHKNTYGLCSQEYYARAEALLESRTCHPLHLFLFTDDPDWVQEHYQSAHPVTVVRANDGNHAHLDLHLMRHCQHAIIANSTFSWWGAWLLDRPGSIIIAPQRWYADGRTPSLFPERWFLI